MSPTCAKKDLKSKLPGATKEEEGDKERERQRVRELNGYVALRSDDFHSTFQ